ncbi:MAG: hypothetical protein GVY19_07630 [Bacteroidetes bacterium]|jgi:hypothetical protein|nr:hypothetical protein [Bacteroidota bacterium]
MKYINNNLIFFIIPLFMLLVGCQDKIDLEKVSYDVYYGGGWEIPGVQGDFTTEDLFNPESDSNFVFYGNDSIVLSVFRDSVFNFNLDDFLSSEQTLAQILNGFSLPTRTLSNPLGDVGPFPSDAYFPNIDSTTFYPNFSVVQEVDIDSMLLNSGSIIIDVTSTFEPDIWLTYKSNAITIDGERLYDSLLITGSGTQTIPLDGATIEFMQSGTTDTDSIYFDITYTLSLDIQAGESINSGDQVQLEISNEGLDDYDYIFGYFGSFVVKSFDELDTFSLNLPELMNKLEGVFNFGNPKVKFHYQNSFGFNQEFDVGMRATKNDGTQDSALFEPPVILEKPENYTDRVRADSTALNAKDLNNLFGELPPPTTYSAAGTILLNPGGRSFDNGYINYVRTNSRLAVGLELLIPMEFGADLAYYDTIPAEDFLNVPEQGDIIDYARLHYIFENGFPFGLDVNLIMLDTVNLQNIDTIRFNEPGKFFIEGAPVDDNGIVTEVDSKTGMLEVTNEEITNLAENTDKVVISIHLLTSGDDVDDPVKLQPKNSLFYRLGLEIKFDGDVDL